jgi:vesicle coat complex subunit
LLNFLLWNRWGRIAILTALADYRPSDSKEAEHIVERVIPQFQHVNGSVVLSAIKVMISDLFRKLFSLNNEIMKFTDRIIFRLGCNDLYENYQN